MFESHKEMSITNYGLDLCHYISLLSLSNDALFKMTGQVLELITDVDMHNFVQLGMRGGVSGCGVVRYAKANNKYMENYNPKEDSVYLPYLDANNLYGWAMSQPLPVAGFKWMTDKELQVWENMPCALEVNLK